MITASIIEIPSTIYVVMEKTFRINQANTIFEQYDTMPRFFCLNRSEAETYIKTVQQVWIQWLTTYRLS